MELNYKQRANGVYILSKEDIEKKKADIEAIRQTIIAGDENYAKLEQKLKEANVKKEQLAKENKEFYQNTFSQVHSSADIRWEDMVEL